MKYIILTLSFLLGILLSAKAQTKQWSLEDCIQYALENNIQIKSQELSAKMAKNNKIQAYGNILPNTQASVSYSFNNGSFFDQTALKFIDQKTEGSDAYIGGSMMLFGFLQNVNGVIKSTFDLKAALNDLEKAKNDVGLNVAAAYLQVLYNKELLEVAKEQLMSSEQQVERLHKEYEVGSKSQGDLLEMKSQYATEKVNLTNAKNSLKLSILSLTQMLNLQTVEGFDVLEPKSNGDLNSYATSNTFDNVVDYAMLNMPEIVAANYRYKSAKKNLAIVAANYLPYVTSSFGYQTYFRSSFTDPQNVDSKYSLREQYKDKASSYVSFKLTVPLFGRLNGYRSISNAKIGKLKSGLDLDLQKQSVYKIIQEAQTKKDAAIDNWGARKEALDSREEAYKYAEKKLEVGMMNTVDFNLVKNNYTKARADYSQAKYEYIFRCKILDFYSGKPLTL